MDSRRIGSLAVSVVGLGCNNFGRKLDQHGTTAVLDAALEAGITLFDTADIYGHGLSEEYLGKALGSRRDDVVVATKFGMDFQGDPPGEGARPEWIRTAVEGSLRRLGTDRIDLYQLHTPDEETPIAETLGTLTELVREGKVREIGCSNFSAAQIEEAGAASEAQGLARFVSVQNQYSLLHREPEDEVLPACERHGLAFLPFFPLHHGLLTGKYRRGEEPHQSWRMAGRATEDLNDASFDVVEALERFAAARGHSVLDGAFAWLLSRPVLASVIAGATSQDQVRANTAAGAWRLAPDEAAEIDALRPA